MAILTNFLGYFFECYSKCNALIFNFWAFFKETLKFTVNRKLAVN